MRSVFPALLTAVALAAATAPAPARAQTWDLAADLQANATSPFPANPFADRQGDPSAWGMLTAATTARDPSSYSLMSYTTNTLCGNAGVVGWGSAGAAGEAHINTTAGAVYNPSCAPYAVFPAHVAMAHPGPANDVMYAWRSPLTGTVRISGSVVDADCHAGDGVAWYIARGATTIASGAIADCGAQAFPNDLTVSVSGGDILYFLVDPRDNYSFDSTRIEVQIQRTSPAPLPGGPSDADGDGSLPPLDCNDGSAAIHPGATDVPGNGTDENCNGIDAPFPKLPSVVRASWEYPPFRFSRLYIQRARPGSRVKVACRGRGCRLRGQTIKVRRPAKKLMIAKRLLGAPLRRGATVTVRVTKPDFDGVMKRFKIKGPHSEPAMSDFCLPARGGAPRSC